MYDFFGKEVQKPIKVSIDNVGAIYLAKKATTSNCTKHVDVRYHFVREYLENGDVEIEFVRSEDNVSDIMTKNLNEQSYWKHASKLIAE